MSAILQNVRVLDLSRYVSGPYCGMMLADMGAEVIRVEHPRGDSDRRIGLKASNGENLTFPGLARNKKGITLDISTPEGRLVLRDLVACSDVFLHNYSPAATRRMRVAYTNIRDMKPEIVYTGISCFGAEGPFRDLGGFDAIAQVASGAAAITGFEDRGPLRSGVPWVDYSTGLCAALGTVLALLHRERSGEGQEVDCALLRTAVSYTAPAIAEAIITGLERPRLGNRTPYLGPCDLYDCRDGQVYLATVTDDMWRALVSLIGRPELNGEGYATDEERYARRGEVDPLVRDWFSRYSVSEAAALLREARLPFGICRHPSEIPSEPHVIAQEMLGYADLGVDGLDRVPISGMPIKFSRTPGTLRSRAPRLGEHNEVILGQMLGYPDTRIHELKRKGVI